MLTSIIRRTRLPSLSVRYCTKDEAKKEEEAKREEAAKKEEEAKKEVEAKKEEPKKKVKPKTAIIMLNMGGPAKSQDVPKYLHRIMTDRDMIQLPVQDKLGPWIAKRRVPEVTKKYNEIGGGSPILKWTELQGSALTERLDSLMIDTAPHKHYVAFRYVKPFTADALEKMEEDGVERAIIFSQYPQYSCATTGSSLNAIADYYKGRKLPKIKFSLIDRWAGNNLLAKVFAERINEKLALFPENVKDEVLILFTAHSLPLKAVFRGDTYPYEIAGTVANTMEQLGSRNPYRLVWQSKVGPLKWLQPYTDEALTAYATKGFKYMILVPIAFVNEHIETLHELDIEYKELAMRAGVIQLERADAPNEHPVFIDAMAHIVAEHLLKDQRVSKQYLTRCAHCTSQRCFESRKFYRQLCGDQTDDNDKQPGVIARVAKDIIPRLVKLSVKKLFKP